MALFTIINPYTWTVNRTVTAVILYLRVPGYSGLSWKKQLRINWNIFKKLLTLPVIMT